MVRVIFLILRMDLRRLSSALAFAMVQGRLVGTGKFGKARVNLLSVGRSVSSWLDGQPNAGLLE